MLIYLKGNKSQNHIKRSRVLGGNINLYVDEGRKEDRKKGNEYMSNTHSISCSGTNLHIYSFNKCLQNFLINSMCQGLGSGEVNRVLAHRSSRRARQKKNKYTNKWCHMMTNAINILRKAVGKTGNGRQMALHYCPMTLEADVPFTKAQCARQKDVQWEELWTFSNDSVKCYMVFICKNSYMQGFSCPHC